MHDKFYKGVMLGDHLDKLVKTFPDVKKYFILISNSGWDFWPPTSVEDIHCIPRHSQVEAFKKKFPAGKYVVLEFTCFISENDFYPIDTEKTYDVIVVSKMEPFKRHELLLKILYNTRKRYKRDVKILIIGISFKKRFSILNFLKDAWHPITCFRNIIRNIRFVVYGPVMRFLYSKAIKDGLPITLVTKFIKKDDLRPLYSKSKIYLLLSKTEGLNKAAREALLCDVPVMVIENCPAAECYVNKYTGRAVEYNFETISRELLEMLDNYKSYSPRKWMLQHSTREHASMKIWEVVNSLQRFPGYPDIDKANHIRKQFTDNELDDYTSLNNINGNLWDSTGFVDKDMIAVRMQFGHYA